ncbi:TetR/AcrR family transcriptional repressor of nem operon [Deinococcus metalli]|uniref:TetR/AcrR family transcriptional repressor of nem operon n=1 Tax=Deinococcus metalli TaxID=1141878 RepID=A0A7W8KDY1_9DEIO|nr:TetR/AcrR family transcriptional regulator [Deinococcus metalli]MBB5376420.1 TetR/AcrR family transcriptional repressor of nem operon [Deinococcus metalli]
MTGHLTTRDRILDVAQHLVQQRGFSSVAYRDISTALGIRNASIHHHFPSKTDLGTALVQRYRARTEALLAHLSAAEPSPYQRLLQYLTAYQDVVRDDGRICLCAQLVAEDCVLPSAVQHEVGAFFALSEDWLTRTLDEGQRLGEVQCPDSPADTAVGLLATIEGAMLLARAARSPQRFEHLTQRALAALRAPTPRSP